MRIQLLSDLHLESEAFEPTPQPGADLLVLAGDIDSTWRGYDRFADWPVPVLAVAGNHEFDGRELDQAWPALRQHCGRIGITLLERGGLTLTTSHGRRVRFLGTVRWSDFDALGAAQRARAIRAGAYFQRVMGATQGGSPFDAVAVRREALACKAWLAGALAEPSLGRWDATVAITHFAPSLRSADPRYGAMPSTASFCNADDALLPGAALWLHGHLHCRHDYVVDHPDGRRTRVVSQARGLDAKAECEGYDARRLIEV
jgi:hypothetical protein